MFWENEIDRESRPTLSFLLRSTVCHSVSRLDKLNSTKTGDSTKLTIGRCDIQAQDTALSFHLNSASSGELDQLKWVVAKHLTRFSQNEIVDLAWQPQ